MKIKPLLFILSFFFICKLAAQTVNTGELVVRPNTEVSTVESFNNTTSGDFLNDGTFYVYADFNNDGLVTFSPATTTGLTYFKGALGAQTISGTALSELNNVRFENNHVQPAFLLSDDISVAGVSDFSYGIVDNINYPGTFVFEDQASHKNTNDDSYVAGYVDRNLNKQFEFPIGDGGFYRPSAIGQINSAGNFSRSRYYLKDSNLLFVHSQKDESIQIIDDSEYWEFISNQTTVDLALTLSWDEGTTPEGIINGAVNTQIAIVRWDPTDKKWESYTSVVDVNNQTATASIHNDGIFTLARVISNTAPTDVVVHNGMSPNDDGKNDHLVIDGLSNYPNNKLEIYNRWGVKVFETTGYGVNDNYFYGYSNGRATVKKTKILPTGTYFYILNYMVSDNSWQNLAGYIYIN